jgi:hypothetical protein
LGIPKTYFSTKRKKSEERVKTKNGIKVRIPLFFFPFKLYKGVPPNKIIRMNWQKLT